MSPNTATSARVAIREALDRGVAGLDDVAGELHVSPSTLQRRLAAESTTFTALRRDVQLRVALELLTDGVPVRRVASRVALSRDHLCVVVREATGFTPRRINRAAQLAKKIERLRAQDPPRSGSWRYREHRKKWRQIDTELVRLLGDLKADHPLAGWAKQVLVAAARPDFRRQPYRERIRRRRRRDAEAREAALRDAERWFERTAFGAVSSSEYAEDAEISLEKSRAE